MIARRKTDTALQPVIGLFWDRRDARSAQAELLKLGFANDEISVMASDDHREDLETLAEAAGYEDVLKSTAGGIVGSLVGGMTSVGGALGAGLGFAALGPLGVGLVAVGVGSVAGGALGVLVGHEMSHHDAEEVLESLDNGAIAVIVHPRSEEAVAPAQALFRASKAPIYRVDSVPAPALRRPG